MKKAISTILLTLVLAVTFICVRDDGRIIARSAAPGAPGICQWVAVTVSKQVHTGETSRHVQTFSISPLPAPHPLFSAVRNGN